MKEKPRWTCDNCGAPEPRKTIWDGQKGSKIKCEHCVERKETTTAVLKIYDKI